MGGKHKSPRIVLIPRITNKPEVVWAYVAGLIDGEGNIQFFSEHQSIMVRIYNTDRRMIDWLYKTFGIGTITESDRRATNPNYKTQFQYVLTGAADVKFLLTNCMPYLIIKREQATKAIERLNALIKKWDCPGPSRSRANV